MIFPLCTCEFEKGRVKVLALFDNYFREDSLVRMGTPYHTVGIRKEIRKAIRKEPDDMVFFEIRERDYTTNL